MNYKNKLIILIYLFITIFSQAYTINIPIASSSISNLPTQRKMEGYIIEILLKYSGEPELVIFQAANAGDYDSVIKLLDYGFANTTDKIEKINGTPNWNVTDSACRSNCTELINYLIEDRRISPTRDHFTYHVKSSAPNLELINFLLSKGYKFPPRIIFDAFHESQYPDYEFHKAKEIHSSKKLIRIPTVEFIKFLIERGAKVQDPNYRLSVEYGMEYVWHALLHNMYVSKDPKSCVEREIIEILLNNGLKADVHSKGMPYTPFNIEVRQIPGNIYCYGTPLGVAIAYEDIDLVRLLLIAGANPKGTTGTYHWSYKAGSKNASWEHGKTMSILDLSRNNRDINKLLLEYWDF